MEKQVHLSDIDTVYNKYFYPITVQLKTTIWLNQDGTIYKCEACYVTDACSVSEFRTESEATEYAQKDEANCKY